MQDGPAMTGWEEEELREMVGRLRKEKEAIRRALEKAIRGKDKQDEELIEVSNENKALSKWGLENMRGRRRISKELLEVKAESEERIIALQDALQEKESRLATAKGEVLEIREQLEAQEERRKGNPKREAQATEWEERPQDKPMRDRQEGDTSGDRELQGVFMVPPGSRRNYRRWPAPTAKQGKKGCCRA